MITMPDGQPAYDQLCTTEQMWQFANTTQEDCDVVTLAFAGGEGLMCCVVAMADIHERPLEQLPGLLNDWIDAYVNDEAYLVLLNMHQCMLLGEYGVAPYDGYLEDGGDTNLPGVMVTVQRQLKALMLEMYRQEDGVWNWEWWIEAVRMLGDDTP
jgi:hypothetical protein